MSDIKDFVIENGVLKKYKGKETEIVIPEGITSIGKWAFYECIKLTTITIPDSVTSIGNAAFNRCYNLTAITIPDSVTSIGAEAFEYCENLTTITIPDSVTSIGENAFFSTSYYNNKSNWEKGVLHIGNHLIKAKKNIPGTYTIRNGTKTIADNAFSESTKLTTITIPESVTSIGDGAFSECDKLRVVNLPQNITSFKGSSLEVIWDALSKTELKEVVLNSFITQLSIEMLNDADLSKKIKANKKLIIDCIIKNDDAEALAKLLNLYKTIKIDELNEYIEKAKDSVSVLAFLLDYKNKNYTIEKQEKHENDKLDKELGLKERTLAEWKKIYSFDVIDVNGAKATITGYKGLDLNVIIPSNIDKYKVVAIADFAFSLYAKGVRKDIKEIRRKIESIVIPESVVRIGNYAFSGCENLTTITIPDSVRKIGEYSFSGCENLTAITIPDGVTSIGKDAFCCCKNLTTITIPDSVTSIGDGAFSWCENLTAITIPNSVTSIGNEVLKWCENLTTITIPNSVTSIGDRAFSYCKNLTTITIPDSVTSIGESAFSKCKNLTSITIPDSVTSIGNEAFLECENLTTIRIPGSVTSIGWSAFRECKNLTTITIPDSVTSIGGSAFSWCTNLTAITIPDSLTSIGYSAFSGCENLTIHAPAGSYAEKYAKENKIKFVAE